VASRGQNRRVTDERTNSAMKCTVAKNEDIVWRMIEDKVVVIGKDAMAIHTLNRTASHIWELCDGVNSPDEIAAKLCDRFDVPPEEAIADVRETIGKFEQMGLIERKNHTYETEKNIAS